MNKTEPQENPLINNDKLRQLYVAMVETRILADHVTKLQSGHRKIRRPERTRGREACLVSTLIELGSGDLVSYMKHSAMDLIVSSQADSMWKRVGVRALDANWSDHKANSRQMPWADDANDRLHMALGAALAFKKLNQANLVLAYLQPDDACGGSWKRTLRLAGNLELPMILVVLPSFEKRKNPTAVGHVSAKAGSYGVPGIPVDSSDAVALYRVMQESIGRIRGGGGPVTIECLAVQTPKGFADPIVEMKKFLLRKKVCTPAWLDRAGDTVRHRIAKAAKQARVRA